MPKLFIILLFIILNASFFISCSGNVDDESLVINFSDSTKFTGYELSFDSLEYKIIAGNIKYKAEVSKNKTKIKDYNYQVKAIYLENNNEEFTFYNSFSYDSIAYLTLIDSNSFSFRKDDSLYTYLIDSLSYNITKFSEGNLIEMAELDSLESIKLKNLNSSGSHYETYQKFKDRIINIYY